MFYRLRRTENGGALVPQSVHRHLMAMHKVGAVNFRQSFKIKQINKNNLFSMLVGKAHSQYEDPVGSATFLRIQIVIHGLPIRSRIRILIHLTSSTKC
jgi:hypothetical protein